MVNVIRKRGISKLNTQNFKLNEIFNKNAREYVTRPVMAAKYQPGMENGFCVHYSNVGTKEKGAMMYEGIRFFPSEAEAWNFINRNEKQYAKENGVFIEMEVIYDIPEPVLYRKDADAENLDGIHFHFGDKAFISDESEDYEFYILDSNCDSDCWIILDVDGNIRVWDDSMDELFFGKESEYVYEKSDKGEYRQVAV